jgi:hypothetical protein
MIKTLRGHYKPGQAAVTAAAVMVPSQSAKQAQSEKLSSSAPASSSKTQEARGEVVPPFSDLKVP